MYTSRVSVHTTVEPSHSAQFRQFRVQLTDHREESIADYIQAAQHRVVQCTCMYMDDNTCTVHLYNVAQCDTMSCSADGKGLEH